MPHKVQLRAEDVGLGAFYYFASVPVINTIAYAGFSRSPNAMAWFFGCLVVTIALVHLAAVLAPPLCGLFVRHIEPMTSILATVSVLCAGLSALGGVGTIFFFLCSLLTGFTCASTTAIWAASPSLSNLRPSAFEIAPPLGWAVLFYLAYRLLQFVSIPVATGWQVAVPLIGMMALLMAYAPDYISMENHTTRRRSFLLLGIVATTYAVASGMLDSLISDTPRAEFNLMALLEAGGAGVMALICLGMRRLETVKTAHFKGAGILLLVLPTFALGCITGTLNVPGDRSNFIWEASIWVLVLAVFVYGMRTSLFAVRGLALGVMWEAWCVGQMATRVFVLTQGSGPLAITTLAAAMIYFAAIIAQVAIAPTQHPAPPAITPSDTLPTCAPTTNLHTALEFKFQLSQREVEVLRLLVEGRSAKYVSEELLISFNTARSHIRHIYEKLDVHSKQELISLMHAQGDGQE